MTELVVSRPSTRDETSSLHLPALCFVLYQGKRNSHPHLFSFPVGLANPVFDLLFSSLLNWQCSSDGLGISRQKWSHCYVCEKTWVIFQKPGINPHFAIHETMNVSSSLWVSASLSIKIECSGHKNVPLQVFHFVECDWPRAPCCLKSVTILAPPAKVWYARGAFGRNRCISGKAFGTTLTIDFGLSALSKLSLNWKSRLFRYPKFPSSLLHESNTCIRAQWFSHHHYSPHHFPSRPMSIINLLPKLHDFLASASWRTQNNTLRQWCPRIWLWGQYQWKCFTKYFKVL